MREKLNENPVAQIAVIGVLVLVAGIFLMKSLGGGEEEAAESGGTSATVTAEQGGEVVAEASASGLEGAAPASSSTSVSAPSARPLPDDVEAAYASGETVVLLIYRSGGIDDRLAADAASVVNEMPGVALFTAPVGEISRYAAITGPLGVNQAPALVVVSPRSVSDDGPAPATVTYGFQSAEEMRQAVIDAGYKGPELTYAPK